MDFFTTSAAPVAINVNGRPHTLPRFLTGAFKEWYAHRRKQWLDEILARIEDREAQGRFLSYWHPAPIDLRDMVGEARSPDGTDHIVRYCLSRAEPKLDDATVEAIMAQSDPVFLRDLADELSTASAAAHRLAHKGDKAKGEQGEDDRPLTAGASTKPSDKSMPESKDASEGSQETTPPTSAPSSPATT